MGWRNDGSWEGYNTTYGVNKGFNNCIKKEWEEISETKDNYLLPDNITLNSDIIEEKITKSFYKREVIQTGYNPNTSIASQRIYCNKFFEYSLNKINIIDYDEIWKDVETHRYKLLNHLSKIKNNIINNIAKENNFFKRYGINDSYFELIGEYNNIREIYLPISETELKTNIDNKIKGIEISNFFEVYSIKEIIDDKIIVIRGIDRFHNNNEPYYLITIINSPNELLNVNSNIRYINSKKRKKKYDIKDLFEKFNER